MKTFRLIVLGLFVVAVMFLVGGNTFTQDTSPSPGVDPIEIIKNAKTPVHLHSLAGGDSLVHDRPTQVCTWWESIYPPNTFGVKYHVDNELENGIPGLNPSDWLNLHHYWPNGDPGGTVWVHVEEVTITFVVTFGPDHLDTMYIEYSGGYDSLLYPLDHPVCTWWHEIWPTYCPWWHITEWQDNGNGHVDPLDYITIVGWWYVWGLIGPHLLHVDSVDSLPSGFYLTLRKPDAVAPLMKARYSGGASPDSVYWARHHPVGTWWQDDWPESNWWRIAAWKDNGNGFLDPCDNISLRHSDVPAGDSLFQLVLGDYPEAFVALKFSGGIDPDSLDRALHEPVCTWWYELYPQYGNWWHIGGWLDDGLPYGVLSDRDYVLTSRVSKLYLQAWNIEDVAIDIAVLSGPYPQTPTMTQWGMIVLVALIIASAVYILLRRRRGTVPA